MSNDWLHALGPMGTFTKAVIEDGPDVISSIGRSTGISGDGGGGAGGDAPQLNAMNYQYGGNPGAADVAVQQAFNTSGQASRYGDEAINLGGYAYGTGSDLLGERTNDAVRFDQRAVQQGDFGAQNQTLGQLGGLEVAQGPSAAQSQLDMGTNQAMAGQLALARSGRGIGGNAAAMGQAQGNMAGIQANQANQAAMLRASEDAAWRQRQAGNLSNVAGMQGQQSNANLSAAVAGRSQNDAAAMGLLGMGQDAYFQGAGLGMEGYGLGMQGAQTSLAGQGLANDIRGQQMQGWQAGDDALLREWAAINGYDLAQKQAQDQKTAAYVSGVSSLGASYIGQGGGRGSR